MKWVVYVLLGVNLGLLGWNLYRGGASEAATRAPAVATEPTADFPSVPLLTELEPGALRPRGRAQGRARAPRAVAGAGQTAPAGADAPDVPAPGLDADADSDVVAGAPGFTPPVAAARKGGVSSGAVFHFAGSDFDEENRLDALPGQQEFGAAAAVSGDRIAIGAPMSDGEGAAAIHRDVDPIFASGFEG